MFKIAATPQQMAQIEAQLAGDPGTKVTSTAPNNYTIIGHGVTATAVYDGTAELTVAVVHKPFLVPESMIESGIKKALAGSASPPGGTV